MIDEDLKKTVKDHYNKGVSIQTIARTYRLSVPEVLAIIDRLDIATVNVSGDLIDPAEVGQGAQFNGSHSIAVPFSLD